MTEEASASRWVRDWSKPVMVGMAAGGLAGALWGGDGLLMLLLVPGCAATLIRFLFFDPWMIRVDDAGVRLRYLLRPDRVVFSSESRIDSAVGDRYVGVRIRNPYRSSRGLSTWFRRSKRNDLATIIRA